MDEARFIAAMLRQSIELGTDVGNRHAMVPG
jgi:hypothetical protein